MTPEVLRRTLTHVVKHMATKDDIARLDTRIDKLDTKKTASS
jgi:hypothetical protein